MTAGTLSRRDFARAVGFAVGATLVAPALPESLHARLGPGMSGEWIQLNANENPYGPSAAAREAMTRSQQIAARYPDHVEGQLVEAIAKFHGVAPENILLGCGSSEILSMADTAFTTPDKNVVVAEPTYEAVLGYARLTRAESIKVPLTGDFRHNLPAMAAVASERTGLVYVCNPNNPTGTIVTRFELAAFLRSVPKTAVILVDEAYHHFAEDPRYASAFEWLATTPNLVISRTFSKIYGMAGMRLGYAAASKELIAQMRTRRIMNNANASVLEAALASLGDPAHVPQHRKLMNDTRKLLVKELERDGRRYIPSEANFVMIDVGGDVQPIGQKFRERRILVGRKFPSLGNWLRVSVGTPEEMKEFMAALREIVPAQAGRAA